MELSDLRIFRTVVRAGGVTRAASQLHRVQSNVTTRIRQLEDELGVPLFLRQGKRLHLSPAGMVLRDYADRLLDLAREAQDALHDTTPRGVLHLGAMESTAAVRLPAPLSEYHRRYPEVILELRTGNPRALATAVLAGELEAALVAEPMPDASFQKVPVFDEELVIVAQAGHPRIKSADDLETRTMLAFEPGCPHRKRLEDWFARQRQLPERTVEMSSYHALLGCAVAGMGIALMPRSVLTTFPEAKRLSVHSLPPGENVAQTAMIWRRGAQSPKIDALVKILLERGSPRRISRDRGKKRPRHSAKAFGR
jgi:DNA-binding transcriptional LysR family regulator